MNLRLVCKLLGMVAALIGSTMAFSLPCAFPILSQQTYESPTPRTFEISGFLALLVSIVLCFLVSALFWWIGRAEKGHLYRKEAMAVVGLSWVLATVLGALPFYFSGTQLSPSVRIFQENHRPLVLGHLKPPLSKEQYQVVQALLDSEVGARGLSEDQLVTKSGEADAKDILHRLTESDDDWKRAILFPGHGTRPPDRSNHYRIRWNRMSFVDSLFESQSGFSTTGATVLCDIEDPALVPRSILFWRSSTHFLGGLGIIVLFVAILGQGSAGKALMRAEMPGPNKEGSQTRMQHAAWAFASIYCGLNLILTLWLMLLGMTGFDALCHAFGTMATGGFSTYNASIARFDSASIDSVIIAFMILAGTNFTLLYFLCFLKPKKMFADVEWRVYMGIIGTVTAAVMMFGLIYGDFLPHNAEGLPIAQSWWQQIGSSLRYGMFQVVSIMTTTGYGTHDFDSWNSFGRCVLFLLMFIGGCAGSTGGGLKVIRYILFVKILGQQLEQSYHPTVVRPLRLGGKNLGDPDNLRMSILVYFGLIALLFAGSWIFVITVEPDTTWGSAPEHVEHKLIDSASAVSATLNNIGPGLGVVGSKKNYANFGPITKLLLVVLMMIGRLEIFVILVLFIPGFWRAR